MRIITKKRINKAADEIIDAVFDHTDFDVEVNGYHDYDVNLRINKSDKPALVKLLHEILNDKKPQEHWKLINVAVRKIKWKVKEK